MKAKLGEKNKFYYDENLKRWVEEGIDHPAEEAALPPPPTTSALQKTASQENLNDRLQAENLHGSSGQDFIGSSSSDSIPGIPPIPRSSMNSTTRGRMGICARYDKMNCLCCCLHLYVPHFTDFCLFLACFIIFFRLHIDRNNRPMLGVFIILEESK